MTVANYHTHTRFCDGKNTPEEVALKAIECGVEILGFSAHGYTPFDLRYCMKDEAGYIKEINRLKEKYKDKIEILLGVEEDAFSLTDRGKYDYIIGSSHYSFKNGVYYPIDSGIDYFKKCLGAWEGDYLSFAEDYFCKFTEYISSRRPDIIGHFDLITKFDEVSGFAIGEDAEYMKIAEKYTKEALRSECVFEINTGAITRGYRKSPYPYKNLLHIIKREGGRVILNSDSHAQDTLTAYFEEAKALLSDIGFKNVSVLTGAGFREEDL